MAHGGKVELARAQPKFVSFRLFVRVWGGGEGWLVPDHCRAEKTSKIFFFKQRTDSSGRNTCSLLEKNQKKKISFSEEDEILLAMLLPSNVCTF